mmetsp:Transcript_27335/g.63734  ORF Transcript_27335/g.63734 Transcript_27335/m.63734 type:complete len:217 (-) Transcript_27335:494-1144(-)
MVNGCQLMIRLLTPTPFSEGDEQIAVVPIQVDNPNIQHTHSVDIRCGEYLWSKVPSCVRALREHLERSNFPNYLVVSLDKLWVFCVDKRCLRHSCEAVVVDEESRYFSRSLLRREHTFSQANRVLQASVPSWVQWSKGLFVLGLEYSESLLPVLVGIEQEIGCPSSIISESRVYVLQPGLPYFLHFLFEIPASWNLLVNVEAGVVAPPASIADSDD